MKSLWDQSGRAGLRSLRTYRKWRLLEPADDRFIGVSSMKGDYDAGFNACTTAARQALRDLDLVVIGGSLHESEARIDARSDFSDVVRITLLAPTESGQTRVTFHLGRVWDPDAKDLVGQLKDAFERHLNELAEKQP